MGDKPVKKVYLGPDFDTPARENNQNKLAEVVIKRLNRNSNGFTFGKYLRNIISNKPFNGLDLVVEDNAVLSDILQDLSTHYEFKKTDSGYDKNRHADYQTFDIWNPKTKTKISTTFWSGNPDWDLIDVDSDVNSLIRINDNKISINPNYLTDFHKNEIIDKIKKGNYELFFKDKNDNISNWSKSHTLNSEGKEGKMEQFKTRAKKDAVEAAYRTAGKQMTKGVKTGIVALMKDKGMDGGKIEAIREVLETEVGDALVATLLGYGLTYAPKLNEDPRAQKLAEEFRISGMATAGNLIVDTTLQYLVPVIGDAMSGLPSPEEEKVRIEEKTSSNEEYDVGSEEEEVEEKQATA
jgi:hypothetical protein